MFSKTKEIVGQIKTLRLSIGETSQSLDGLGKVFCDKRTMALYPQFLAEDTKKLKSILELLERNEVYVFPIILNEREQVVGFITLNNIEIHSKRIEIGYFLASCFWENGYAREIVISLIEELTFWGWHRIEATVYSGNEKSEQVLIDCGFKKEGCLRDKYLINGKYHDDIIYSIINR